MAIFNSYVKLPEGNQTGFEEFRGHQGSGQERGQHGNTLIVLSGISRTSYDYGTNRFFLDGLSS